MKLYTIREIGHNDESHDVRLPSVGQINQIAFCTNVESDPPMAGTGDGWREITRDQAAEMLKP